MVVNDLLEKYMYDNELNFDNSKAQKESVKSIGKYLKMIKRYDVNQISKREFNQDLHSLFSIDNYVEYINEGALQIYALKWSEKILYKARNRINL